MEQEEESAGMCEPEKEVSGETQEGRGKFSTFREKLSESHLLERKMSNALAASYGAT